MNSSRQSGNAASDLPEGAKRFPILEIRRATHLRDKARGKPWRLPQRQGSQKYVARDFGLTVPERAGRLAGAMAVNLSGWFNAVNWSDCSRTNLPVSRIRQLIVMASKLIAGDEVK